MFAIMYMGGSNQEPLLAGIPKTAEHDVFSESGLFYVHFCIYLAHTEECRSPLFDRTQS